MKMLKMKMPKPSLSVVLPMYNEEGNLPLLIPALEDYLRNVCSEYEIIAVENGSKDNTLKLMLEYGKKNRKIKVLHLDEGNYGRAIRLGFSHAKMGYVMYMDSDLPFTLDVIGRALPFMKKNDAVIGFPNYKKRSFIRNFSSKCYNLLVWVFFGIKVKHPNFAFKMMKKDLLDKMKLTADYWMIDLDLLWGMKKNHAKIYEIYIMYKPRVAGVPTVRVSAVFEMFFGLLKYFFQHRILHKFG